MKHANRVIRPFLYVNAADSAKPGYLKAKFEKIRKVIAEAQAKQRMAEAEAAVKVRRMR